MAKPKEKRELKGMSVFFATFSPWESGKRMPTNGMIEPMVYYFKPRVKRFIVLDGPHPGSDIVNPIIERYRAGKLETKSSSGIFVKLLYPFLAARNTVGTRMSFKVRDFLAVFDFFISDRKKFDLFIGLESIYALAGVILRKLGMVGEVVYYVSDFSPSRYSASWYNKLYLALDRLAATHSDYVWDVSPAMMPARSKVGLDKEAAAPVVPVPNALFHGQISYLPLSKINHYGLVYAGTLGPENGPDLAIEAMEIVVKKIPKAKLHIFGGGKDDLARLKKLTQKLGLTKSVVFHGFFTDQVKLSQTIKKLGVGLAPYRAFPGSPRWWADATKIRLYLAAGLPVVTTQVPPLGKEMTKKKAGVAAKDNPKDQANAIIKILLDKKTYKEYRENAIKMAEFNTWENTYDQAFEKMGVDVY